MNGMSPQVPQGFNYNPAQQSMAWAGQGQMPSEDMMNIPPGYDYNPGTQSLDWVGVDALARRKAMNQAMGLGMQYGNPNGQYIGFPDGGSGNAIGKTPDFLVQGMNNGGGGRGGALSQQYAPTQSAPTNPVQSLLKMLGLI